MPTVLSTWVTFFKWRGLTWLPRLLYGYRAPVLFAATMAERRVAQGVVGDPDERALASDYDGNPNRRAEGHDILYFASHGRQGRDGFELLLHADAWRPAAGGLDGDGPRIVVFDACNLVDLNELGSIAPWEAGEWPRLRLVLGFASEATVSKGAGLRGEAFAEFLAGGMAVAQAWHRAVWEHSPHSRDRSIAIAFGADDAEAEALLQKATLDEVLSMPTLESGARVLLG